MIEEKAVHTWLRILLATVALLAALWVFYAAHDIVILLVIAVLTAYALSPVVDFLEKVRLPLAGVRVGRGVAAVTVVIAVLVIVGIVLSRVVPAIAAQLSNVLADLPSYVERLRELVAKAQSWLGGKAFLSSWLLSFEQELGRISLESGRYIGKGLFTAVNIVVKLLGLVLLPIVTFYILKDGRKFVEGFLRVVPVGWRPRTEEILRDVDAAFSSYVRGLAIVCLVMGICVAVALAAIGINSPLVLGIFAGACEAIPFVGFVLASAAIVLVGLFENPWMALKGFLVYLTVNQFLSYVVTPRVMGRRMKLHPLTVMLSIMVGAKVAGVAGVVFALPAVAAGKVLLMHLISGGKSGNAAGTINP